MRWVHHDVDVGSVDGGSRTPGAGGTPREGGLHPDPLRIDHVCDDRGALRSGGLLVRRAGLLDSAARVRPPCPSPLGSVLCRGWPSLFGGFSRPPTRSPRSRASPPPPPRSRPRSGGAR